MIKNDLVAMQKRICAKYGADFVPASEGLKLGISLNVREGMLPINGVRCPVEGDTTGWYIWAGEVLSEDVDFFRPLHVSHVEQWCPQVLKYLGLPPGWRFLCAGDYEDVWFDPGSLRSAS